MSNVYRPPFSFTHAINPLKGWPSPSAVDYPTLVSSNVTAPAYSGRCAHLNSSGQFELGCVGSQMPIFLIPFSFDPDVTNPSPGGGTGPYDWTAVEPGGNSNGLVANGAYEIETTEYDQTGSYAYNTVLHSPTEAQITVGAKTNAGMLYAQRNWGGGDTGNITEGTDQICGVVSRVPFTNAARQNAIAFWPVRTAGASAST